jgi:dsRNA-specific ribonuclease
MSAKIHPNPQFKMFIKGILETIKLSDKHINELIEEKNLIEFTKCFTRTSIDPLHNSEYYELIGDVTTNKIVVDYFTQKFKYIFGSGSALRGVMGSVAILSRLKQKYISKAVYSRFAENLGFWEYIQRLPEEEKDKTRMCEDAFESFMGCLEHIVDEIHGRGVGFFIVEKLMYPLLESLNIQESDLTEDKLYDPKSMVNNVYMSSKISVKLEYKSNFNKELMENPETYMKAFSSFILITDLYDCKEYTTQTYYWSTKTEAENLAAKEVVSRKIIEEIVNRHRLNNLIYRETDPEKGTSMWKRTNEADWACSKTINFDFKALKEASKNDPNIFKTVIWLEKQFKK